MRQILMLFLLSIPYLVFSINGGGGYFIFGNSILDIDKLNSTLKDNGYSEMSDNFVSFGGGGCAVIDNLIIGGEGHGISGREEDIGNGYKASISAGYGFFNVGYMIFNLEKLSIYPVLGIGGGGMDVKILEKGLPSFNDILSNPKRGTKVSTGGLLLSISISTEYLLGLGKNNNNKGGIILGLRFGYIWSPNYNWTLDGNNIPGAPDGGINGYFVRLLIGFGGFSY